ncbi:MAG: flagellar protein export ATPase FliI [Lachnospiraceae bacterium]|nr:flagellar protein export ATPase FliI [Lachnospiraceae bacterium]
MDIDAAKYLSLAQEPMFDRLGKVLKVVGLTIESLGPVAKLNDLCEIQAEDGRRIMAEVVGFRDKVLILMPYEKADGVGVGCVVENTGRPLTIKVGDCLLGHTTDGIGVPTDIDDPDSLHYDAEYPVDNDPPDPMDRVIIKDVLPLGVKAVDGLITVGKGQRIGIFAGSGVGKSTIMGMFARNTKAEVNVIALIGERGREVREFVENDLKAEGMARSVVVIATSDKPALIRKKAALTATAIAEYFRNQGKDVLLMMDSLTRFCMAQREIGLASGEPPVTRGYPPSIYAEMPRLLERAGNGAKGSITGLYTVLVDGDDMNEPITDTARSILDGHIMLNRKLAQKNQYPAIDVLQSISRVMSAVADKYHKNSAGQLKNVMATYQESEDLINIGAYKKGSNKNIDFAISKYDDVINFIKQDVYDKYTFEEIVSMMEEMFPPTNREEAAVPEDMMPQDKIPPADGMPEG